MTETKIDNRAESATQAAPDTTKKTRRKSDVETYTVGDHTVELTRVEPHQHVYGGAKEKNRFEVRVDGAFVGHAWMQNGFGRQHYHATALWKSFTQPMGEPDLSKYLEFSQRMQDRAAVAARFVEWVATGRALTTKQIEAKIKAFTEERHRQETAFKAKQDERRIARAEAAQQAEAKRMMTIEGLSSIRDRMRDSLTNVEIASLEDAIERYKADGEK